MTDVFGSSYANMLGNINGMFDRRAQRQAGRAIAGGNYQAGADALLQNGDLQGGLRVRGIGQEQAAAEQAMAQAAEAEQIAFTKQAVKALSESQNPLADFDAMVPAFRQLGTDDAQIGQLRQGLETGGRQFLDQVDRIANDRARQLEIQNLGNGYGVAIDKQTGEVVNEYRAPAGFSNANGVVYNDQTGEPVLDAREPKYQTIQNSDGSSSLVAVDQPAAVSLAPRSSGGGGSAGGADAISVIQSILPEARFTSGLRTPDQNRSAGGAANSFHLRGQAVDIAPPAGVSLADFRRQLESSGVNVKELINEGDHWHIAWEGGAQAPNIGRGEPVRSGGGVRVVAAGANNGPTPAAARAEAREGRVAERQARTDSRQLRRDFESQDGVKEYETVRSSYNRLQALARSGSATDDTAIGFEFMKMLDPTSVVRESEYALVGQSQGITGQALVALQRLSSGQRLTPELRRNLVDTGRRVFEGRQARYNELVQQYRGYAQEDGFDPDRVVPIRNGAASGSRRTIPFTEAQIAASRAIPGGPRGDRGTQTNPINVNQQDERGSLANIPPNAWFFTPQGELLRMPNPNPYRRRR